MKLKSPSALFMWLMLVVPIVGFCQATNYSPEFVSNVKRMHELISTSSNYQNAALRAVLVEANKIAQELHLPESLPITATNLTASYITPPRIAQRLGSVGNVTTANYTYFCSVGNKFSYLAKTGLEQDYSRLRKENLLPLSQMDTNAAYDLAVKWLAAVSMDVKALNRDCKIHILAFTPEGEHGQHFVPVYWVYWSLPEQEGHGSVASVELFEPSKTIRQLRVEVSKYILRPPLEIANLEFLLSQTNIPTGTNTSTPP